MSNRMSQMQLLGRLKPIFQVPDTSTPEGRGQERHRRLLLASIAAILAKLTATITTLISVPLTVNYLGPERYGLWMTISSAVAMIGFADLGLGNGLINAISEADGKDDHHAAKSYVSSALFLLTAVALVIALVFTAIFPFFTWEKLFSVSSAQAISEIKPTIIVCFAFFILSIPLGVTNRIQIGYQESFANNVWSTAGSVASLVTLLVFTKLHSGLPGLVFAIAGVPVIVNLCNGLLLFLKRKRFLMPNLKFVDKDSVTTLFSAGILFFILQIASTISYSSDNIVISYFLGSAAVTQYAVPFKLFSMPIIFSTLLLNPLWPAYREAIARGDIPWVVKTIKRSVISVAICTGACSLFLIFFGKYILHLWVGDTVYPRTPLLVGLGLWIFLGSVGNAISMLFNAARYLKFYISVSLASTVANIFLSIILVKSYGISGVIWGTVGSFFFFGLLPSLAFIPKLLKDLERKAFVP